MGTAWFCLVAAMLTTYIMLDDFDLGAGIVHLLAANTEEERRMVLRSIGPVWDGNEVWLIAAAMRHSHSPSKTPKPRNTA